MKKFTLIFALLFISTSFFAQSEVQTLVSEGITHHDNGDYDKAISSYKKALKFDPRSALVNYEMAFSYFLKGDYNNSIKHSDVVLEQNDQYLIDAYITKGNSLDLLGRTKESIKLFEKAIKKTEGHYLLYYNLALNHYNIGEYETAEENAIKAIEINQNHGSSHVLLANLNNGKGNKVQTLLSTHFFLLVEPNSTRSGPIYDMLMDNFGGNVTEDSDDPNTITINLDPSGDDEFMAVELMIGMLAASKSLEENEGKTEDEIFIENTTSFFMILGELKDKKNDGIYWDFYTPFFYDLAQSEHMETYCKYITQNSSEASQEWLSNNSDKLKSFVDWLVK